MQIDNYQQAIALTEQLKAALPFRVRPGKQLLIAMKHEPVSAQTWLEVDHVMYAGDEGGIAVHLVPLEGKLKQEYVVSLTHVVIDPAHELAAAVKDYQQQKIYKLVLANSTGFAAELLRKKQLKKRKSRKGFWGPK